MRQRMVVTDLMAVDAGVSVAGYLPDPGKSVRPVPPRGSGFPWRSMVDVNGVPIEPFSEVEINLGDFLPNPPFLETVLVDSLDGLQVVRHLTISEQHRLLLGTLSNSVEAIFGTEIFKHRYTRPGSGIASIGTIRTDHISYVNLDADANIRRDRYDIEFRDGAGVRYSLRVTDLAFREFCRRQRSPDRRDIAALRVRERVNRSREIYLRLGLSLPFQPRGSDARCYLVITGVHTFPTYLDGSWAHYYPTNRQASERRDPDEMDALAVGQPA